MNPITRVVGGISLGIATIAAIGSYISGVRSERTDLKNKLETSQRELIPLREQFKKKKNYCADITGELIIRDARIAVLEERIVRAADDDDFNTITDLSNQLAELRNESDHDRGEIRRLQQALVSDGSVLGAHESEFKELHKQINEKDAQIVDLERQLTAAHDLNDQLKTTIAQQSAMADKKNREYATLQSKYDNIMEAFKETSDRLYRAEDKIIHLKRENGVAIYKAKRYEQLFNNEAQAHSVTKKELTTAEKINRQLSRSHIKRGNPTKNSS